MFPGASSSFRLYRHVSRMMCVPMIVWEIRSYDVLRKGVAGFFRKVGVILFDYSDKSIFVDIPSAFRCGVVFILSGGPYIPRDGIAGVEDIMIDDVASAVSIWPQPAREELNIAWRGDLHRMPARFEVHDLVGRLVAAGDVLPSAGAAVWSCSGTPPGVYMLTIVDRSGWTIASSMICKEN